MFRTKKKRPSRRAVARDRARQAAGQIGPLAKSARESAAQQIGPLAKSARESAAQGVQSARDWSAPHLQTARDWSAPHVQTARDWSGPHVQTAREWSGPRVEQAVQLAGPKVSAALEAAAHRLEPAPDKLRDLSRRTQKRAAKAGQARSRRRAAIIAGSVTLLALGLGAASVIYVRRSAEAKQPGDEAYPPDAQPAVEPESGVNGQVPAPASSSIPPGPGHPTR